MKELITRVAKEKDFKDTKLLVRIAKCESELVPTQRGIVDKRDRGLFQISSRWNPQVSDKQAFNPEFATRWTIDEIENGNLWKWEASKHCWL